MSQKTIRLAPQKKYIFFLLLFVVGLYALIPQFGDFKQSPEIIRNAKLPYVLGAIMFTAATYFAAAGTYKFLAFKKLSLVETTLVQYGAMFINRLLPAGVGALGANYLYLKHEKHTDAQAATTVATNNMVGFIGNSILILVVLAWTSSKSNVNFNIGSVSGLSLLKLLVISVVVTIILTLIFGRKRFGSFIKDVGSQLYSYRERPQDLVGALATSLLLTLFNILALECCLLALGIHLPFVAVVLVLSFGVGIGAATPSPGGLGGFEAGLVAGFVAYHVNPATALAAALLYRFISYWLALIFGAAAFYISQRKKLFSQNI